MTLRLKPALNQDYVFENSVTRRGLTEFHAQQIWDYRFLGVATNGYTFSKQLKSESGRLGDDEAYGKTVDFLGRASDHLVLGNKTPARPAQPLEADPFVIFPNGQVQVGSTWNDSIPAHGTRDFDYAATYSLERIDGQVATIKAVARLQRAGQSGGNGPRMDGVTVYQVDLRDGLVVKAGQHITSVGMGPIVEEEEKVFRRSPAAR